MLNCCQVHVPISEDDGIDDEKLKTKRGNNKPLRAREPLSQAFSQSPDERESFIIVELPGKHCTYCTCANGVPLTLAALLRFLSFLLSCTSFSTLPMYFSIPV